MEIKTRTEVSSGKIKVPSKLKVYSKFERSEALGGTQITGIFIYLQ